MEASLDYVSQRAYLFLSEMGYHPATDRAAYPLFVALAAKEEKDRSGQKVLERLRTMFDDPYQAQPWRKRQEIFRLCKQLQYRKRLHTLSNKFGAIIPDP